MAPTKREIRDAASEAARADAARTITDLAEKVDVGKVSAVVHKAGAQAKEHLSEYASEGKAKASSLRGQAGEKVPAQVAAVENAMEQARDAAVSNARSPKGRRLLVSLLLMVVVGVLLRRFWNGG